MHRYVLLCAAALLLVSSLAFAEPEERIQTYLFSNKPRKIEYFEHGVRNGPITIYYRNGNIRIKGHFDHGKLHGEVFRYYKDGTLRDEWLFAHGKPDGLSKTYLPNGVLLNTRFYQEGRIQWMENYRNGVLFNRREYSSADDEALTTEHVPDFDLN